MKQVYIGGDMLYKGSQLIREQEKRDIESVGLKPYAPQDDKEINDKSNQTKEANDGLAEKIVRNDTKAMLESDIVIFDYQRFCRRNNYRIRANERYERHGTAYIRQYK